MRDFRDAKLMAHTLREALALKHHKITVGESLEMIAHLFGVADWNTLSALIKKAEGVASERRGTGHVHFAPTTEEALHRALGVAVERGQKEATVEHLLLSLTSDTDARSIMKSRGIDVTDFRNLIAQSIESELTPEDIRARANPKPSPAFQRVVQRAILDLQASGGGSVTGANLLAAILLDEDSAAARMLRDQGME